MKRKSERIALIVLTVALLVVVSSRVTPGDSHRAEPVMTTDDPVIETLPPETEATPEVTPEPEETPPAMQFTANPGDWKLKLVNETYVLSSSFAPNVTDIGNGQYFDSRAVDALLAMIAGAEEAGYTVCVRNAYRPYSTQAYLFFGRASQIQWGTDMDMLEAEALAREVVAYPGTSEHQLGLVADLMDSEDTVMDADAVKNLPVLQWLTEHCADYGFILRYPEDKQDITGWFEPWHFRYVGEECAAYIMENGLCLEEFLEQLK